MKKLIRISFLLIILCSAIPAFADDGDMGTGNKNCTSGCLVSTIDTPSSTDKTVIVNQQDKRFDDLLVWLYQQFSKLTD